MEQFGHVDKLLASLNRLVEEDVEPTTPKDDRFKSIEETLQAVTSSVDEVNQRVKQIVELCYSQGQVFTKIYYRSEAANKDTESQLKDIKKQIAHLSGQLQAAIQIGSHGSHGSGVSFPSRFLNSAQLSPISAGTSISPVSTTAFVPASTTPQVPNVSSIPSIFQRGASSMIQPNVPVFDDRMGTAATPATNETPFRAHISQGDTPLQPCQQQQQQQQQQQKYSHPGIPESSNHPLLLQTLSAPDGEQKAPLLVQDASAQQAALAFFKKHNQLLSVPEAHSHPQRLDKTASLVANQPFVPSSVNEQLANSNAESIQEQQHQQQAYVQSGSLISTHAPRPFSSCVDHASVSKTTQPALKAANITLPRAKTASGTAGKPASTTVHSETNEMLGLHESNESAKPTATDRTGSATKSDGASSKSSKDLTTGKIKSISQPLANSGLFTSLKTAQKSAGKDLPDESKYHSSGRSSDHASRRSRSRSPPARRSSSHTRSHHSSSRTDRPHSTRSRDSSPCRMQVTIKGSNKHHRDNEPAPESQPSKRRNTSPRISSNNIAFLADSGSDSGTDIDYLIEQRFSHTEGSSRRNDRGEVDIGIVGASASNKGSNSSKSISKGKVTSSSKHRPHSPASDEYERYSDYDYYDRSSSTDRGSDGRHSPGGGYHISDRLSDQRDINLRLNIASSRSATIIPLRDSAGNVLSAERVSRIMGPFIFIGTPMISPLYKMFYGCQALSTGVKAHELNRAITGLDGFKFWSARNYQSDSSYNKFLAFVSRDGPEFGRLQRRISTRLLGGNYVLGPLLCYFVSTLAMVNVSLLTGPLIESMFRKVMNKSIASLKVVTRHGIERLSADEIAQMTSKWLLDITGYIHSNSRAPESLDKADRCYRTYVSQCRSANGDAADMDPKGDIAREMMTTDREKSQLFLGIRSSELQQLYKYLVQMVTGSVSTSAVLYLRHVSESYIDRE